MHRLRPGGGGAPAAGRPRYQVDLKLLRLTDVPYANRHVFARWKAAHMVKSPHKAATNPALVIDAVADWDEAFQFEIQFPAGTVVAPAFPIAAAATGSATSLDQERGTVLDAPHSTVDLPPSELVIEIRLVRALDAAAGGCLQGCSRSRWRCRALPGRGRAGPQETAGGTSSEEIGVVRLDLAEVADEVEHAERHLLQRARMNAMLEASARGHSLLSRGLGQAY